MHYLIDNLSRRNAIELEKIRFDEYHASSFFFYMQKLYLSKWIYKEKTWQKRKFIEYSISLMRNSTSDVLEVLLSKLNTVLYLTGIEKMTRNNTKFRLWIQVSAFPCPSIPLERNGTRHPSLWAYQNHKQMPNSSLNW